MGDEVAISGKLTATRERDGNAAAYGGSSARSGLDPHRVLWIGPPDEAAFDVAERRRIAVRIFATIREAMAALADDVPAPELIVLAAARPGEISAAEIDRLRDRAPLSRFIGWLGSWCEGETRTGRPWAAVTRAYWHQGPARLSVGLADAVAGRCPVWGLPVTAHEEEWLEFVLRGSVAASRGGVPVYIHAFNRDAREWLCDACRLHGYMPERWLGDEPPPGAAAAPLVLDGDTLDERLLKIIREWRTAVPASPIVLLLNFPRREDVDAARAGGATTVLAKPVLIADFLTAIAPH